MISYQHGDLLAADTEALVNTVNCVGVMGKGIALDFKKAFPKNFKQYAEACKQGNVKPGRMFITEQTGQPRYIINFPTQTTLAFQEPHVRCRSGSGCLCRRNTTTRDPLGGHASLGVRQRWP